MKNIEWPQILVVTVIIGGLGSLAVSSYQMNGTLSRIDTEVAVNKDRLIRIVDVLPEVRARVAWEEFNMNVVGFVATSLPKYSSTGQLVTSVKLYDSKSGHVRAYALNADDSQKKAILAYLVAGLVASGKDRKVTFEEMNRFASEMRAGTPLPAGYDLRSSFVFRDSSNDRIAEYAEFLEYITGGKPVVLDAKPMRTWEEVSGNLDSLEASLDHYLKGKLEDVDSPVSPGSG